MAKKLSQREAVQLVGIDRNEPNRLMPLTKADVAKLVRRGLIERSGDLDVLRLSVEGREALRRWMG